MALSRRLGIKVRISSSRCTRSILKMRSGCHLARTRARELCAQGLARGRAGHEQVSGGRGSPNSAVAERTGSFVTEMESNAASEAALRLVPFKCLWQEVQACAGALLEMPVAHDVPPLRA